MEKANPQENWKDTNPKDALGVSRAPLSCISGPALYELGRAMLEGACKYRRHNYRISGVRHSVYFDAAMRHLWSWWEGEDIDPKSGVHHLMKAAACMFVMRDSIIAGNDVDDRPPVIDPEFIEEMNALTAKLLGHMVETEGPIKPPHTEVEEQALEEAEELGMDDFMRALAVKHCAECVDRDTCPEAVFDKDEGTAGTPGPGPGPEGKPNAGDAPIAADNCLCPSCQGHGDCLCEVCGKGCGEPVKAGDIIANLQELRDAADTVLGLEKEQAAKAEASKPVRMHLHNGVVVEFSDVKEFTEGLTGTPVTDARGNVNGTITAVQHQPGDGIYVTITEHNKPDAQPIRCLLYRESKTS